jgi:hypothetical protein
VVSFRTRTLYTHLLPHTYYMPHPSHSSQFYHQDIIRWGVQIMKLLIMFPYIDLNPKRKQHSCYSLPVTTAVIYKSRNLCPVQI